MRWIECIKWLLDNDTYRALLNKKQPVYSNDWPPDALNKRIIHLFSKNKWYPQEVLGLEELKFGLEINSTNTHTEY